jgi:hypothetical protein
VTNVRNRYNKGFAELIDNLRGEAGGRNPREFTPIGNRRQGKPLKRRRFKAPEAGYVKLNRIHTTGV